MCCRSRTPKFFQVRANMIIKKKSVKTFCCYDQNQQPLIFSLLLFLVGICCRNKKMLPKCCPRMKKYFLLKNFFSKSLSNVSSDPGHRWSIFFSEKGRHKKKIPTYFRPSSEIKIIFLLGVRKWCLQNYMISFLLDS